MDAYVKRKIYIYTHTHIYPCIFIYILYAYTWHTQLLTNDYILINNKIRQIENGGKEKVHATYIRFAVLFANELIN